MRLHVGDAAAARIAAAVAGRVPGVVGLRADLGQALLGAAGAVLGTGVPADGTTAAVDGTAALVAVTIVTPLGANCRDVAEAVQRAVVTELAEQAGLTARVTVTIADVVG